MTEETKETTSEKADDPVAAAILEAMEDGRTPTIQDIARQIAEQKKKPGKKPGDKPDLWRRYMTAVRQQAVHMARTGRIEIVRKGKVIDPKEVKGLVRLRLPG